VSVPPAPVNVADDLRRGRQRGARTVLRQAPGEQDHEHGPGDDAHGLIVLVAASGPVYGPV